MAKYLLLKHYRRGVSPAPAPGVDSTLEGASEAEWGAHVAFMGAFNDRLRESGEFVDAQALAPTGTFVRYGGPGAAPVTDGPFAEAKELVAGWLAVDVDSRDRAYEIAAELSAAPGRGGEPIYEWLEVRPFMETAPATFDEITDAL